MRSLNPREVKLLLLCFATLFTMGNLIGIRFVTRSLSESNRTLQALRLEEAEQRSWLAEDDPAPLQAWLDAEMPQLQSAGKAQGALLERLQNEAFERKLEIERQNLLEPQTTRFYREVSVNVILDGELAQITALLTQLQQPGQFLVIKNLELRLDTESKEKEPQARCNLTVAQWFIPSDS